MEKTIAEILDGYSISYLKNEKIPSVDTKNNFEEYQKGLDEIKKKYPKINWDIVVKPFIDVNRTIWHYEAAIRQGVIDDDPAQIAARAVLVREFNRARVGLGNVVLALLGEGMLNLKKEHASE